MNKLAAASILLGALTVWPASAQVRKVDIDLERANGAIAGRFYISVLGSRIWEDKERETDAGWGGALTFGKQFSPLLSAELSTFYSDLHVNGVDDHAQLLGYGVSALISPLSGPISRNVFGIVGVHAGQVDNHPGAGDGDYDTVFGDVGLGFIYGPFNWLNQGSFRVETRYRVDFHDERQLGRGNASDFRDIIGNVGVLVPIGAQPQPPPPPAPPVEVVPVVEPPADSDGDGVTDDLDQCPNTPAGEPVDGVGCPLPKKKECKSPEPGQPVDLEGCATGDKIVLRGVNFDFNKSTLTANAKSILNEVTTALNSAPSVEVEIGGHTDSKGSDEYNQKLSERRAASVVQYLIGQGIDPNRMSSVGYGEHQPVADNETDDGRELNRRVELKVTGGSVAVEAPPPAEAPILSNNDSAEPESTDIAPAADE